MLQKQLSVRIMYIMLNKVKLDDILIMIIPYYGIESPCLLNITIYHKIPNNHIYHLRLKIWLLGKLSTELNVNID